MSIVGNICWFVHRSKQRLSLMRNFQKHFCLVRDGNMRVVVGVERVLMVVGVVAVVHQVQML